MWRSVRQTPQARTRRRTWPGLGCGSAVSAIRNGRCEMGFGEVRVAAFMMHQRAFSKPGCARRTAEGGYPHINQLRRWYQFQGQHLKRAQMKLVLLLRGNGKWRLGAVSFPWA